MDGISRKWKTLGGENHWVDLLDPLDSDLRRYIIHYGEMAQAARDAFISEKTSNFAGSSLFHRSNLLSAVGIEDGNPFRYQVTKYFYGTSSVSLPSFLVKSLSREAWSKESNWIGYVAVATEEGKAALGRRDIVIAWRGTVQTMEWINDLKFVSVSAPEIFRGTNDVKVQDGWHSIYTTADPRSPFNKSSARHQVSFLLCIFSFGHSMGGALATLNAADIVSNGFNKPLGMRSKAFPVTAFVFASPRVGDSDFKNLVSAHTDIRVLRVQNEHDVVPHYPLMIGYSHVGEALAIDTTKSPYLKSPGDIQRWHDMETYLHGIAGTQGSKGGFELEVNRDIALVNKYTDGLKDEYHVPASWWVEKVKSLVQQADMSWLLKDCEEDDDDDDGDDDGDGDDNTSKTKLKKSFDA
ncbi:Lipase, class 3 [Cynara cardunculus var. scolymus]|uniref:Phospholipase A1 n=1 Tax=Cynara cardunculus var. scolymus TaxID=59895 RepID=A0A103Y1Z0_CYNCS|nr:Lipase, class 3 [Cynara cardunculus var. scolymus]